MGGESLPFMPAFKSIAGQRFGRLTARSVAMKSSRTSNRATQWLCTCDCGTERVIARSSLTAGLTRSCGCLAEEHLSTVRLPGGLASMRRQVVRYKKQAIERGLPWELSESDCMAMFTADCHYCGTPPGNFSRPTHGSTHGGCFYNGIDRVDSDCGYVAGNVVTSCFICNRAKSVLGYRAFVDWVQRCHSHMKARGRKKHYSGKEPGRLFACK